MSRYIDIEPLMTPDNMVEEREDTGIDELPYKIKYGLDINVIRTAPAADVVEVRHGYWNTSDTILGRCCVCSECGSCPTMEYKYCPYCGAKMDGERREREDNNG